MVELEDVDLLGQWERWKQSAGAGPVARMVLAKDGDGSNRNGQNDVLLVPSSDARSP